MSAEYSFAGIDKPIGISTYELTRALPAVEQIDAKLEEAVKPRRIAGPERKGDGV